MKRLFLILCLCVIGHMAFAQQNPQFQELRDRIEHLEIITQEDIPFPFDYETDTAYKDQDAINVFYAALNKYQKNPNNFAAVFNYAMLVARKSCSEGYTLGEREYDEAFLFFEKAKTLNGNYLPVYQEQERIIDMRLSYRYAFSSLSFSLARKIESYLQYPDLARKKLEVIKQQIRLGGGDINYYDLVVISHLFQRTEDVKKYWNRAGGTNIIQEEVDSSVAEIHYEFSTRIFYSENWQQHMGAIETAEKHVDLLKKYYGDYLQKADGYGVLLDHIREEREKAVKMRNQEFAENLGRCVNVK
ncbi:MAG: hypothetical protein IJ311_02845 [Elusimicrobiaceae bacterium]|nr:hypothetical protein [Elusimicrobiaceae bacterium]